MKEIKLSIIIPVYNEEDNIPTLYKKLSIECREINKNYEIIFVDDGSTDKTLSLLIELQSKNPTLKIIKLSRNHGHQLALSAGIDYSSGEFTLTMDADLQHPPELISKFLKEAEAGYDIVTGVKMYTEKRGFIKILLAKTYYWIFNKITRINVEPNASDFRLYSKKAIEVIKGMRERERYLRGISEWIGFRQKKINYICPPRYAGKPKYTIMKLGKLASYGLFSFSAFPLRVSTYIGIIIVVINIIYMIYSFLTWIKSPESVPGYTSIIIFILFLFSFLFVSLGILGEYILRIYEEVKGRPLYIMDWKTGFGDDNQAEKEG
ncbi:MAG: glycosyltransferase family 2 protein [Thermodesulfobacteriota bacterium]|nr:glycosyltransferase family 2 protein [Thermodesulfobacteriota bacterium]